MMITNEEVYPGPLPQWLKDHLRSQIIDNKSYSQGGKSRLLIIYPNTESRREMLESLTDEGFVIDNTLHHTISSLKDSIMADFRMPRLLQNDPSFQLILHEECKKESSKLGFPIINPLPDMNWSRGKTTALADLHSFLSSESAASGWDGPGIRTFRQVLRSLELKLNVTHNDFLVERIIEKLKTSEKPFSLIDVDGIIMLNHSPTIPQSEADFIRMISCHSPIHQLSNAGNFRLGKHGLLLKDEWPINEKSELPGWVPVHNFTKVIDENKIERVLLQRENQSFEAAFSFATKKLHESPDQSVLIIDPNFENNKHIWNRGLKNLGFPISSENLMITNHPLGHWFNSYLNLSYGNDAFSLDKLRALSIQNSLTLFPEIKPHPLDKRITPVPDPKILSKIARTNHILGGPETLIQWLSCLESDFDFGFNEEEDNLKKESTQWWLLCVVKWLSPILSGPDRSIINESSNVGVYSKHELPLPTSPKSGDEWFFSTLKLSRQSSLNSEFIGDLTIASGVIQSLVSEFMNLRDTQKLLQHKFPIMGPDWADEISNLIGITTFSSSVNLNRHRLRILSCDQALGCTSDIAILTNVSSISWNLKVPKMHFLGDQERNESNLLRPDGPVRNARHNFEHILKCASEVIILDPSLDDANPSSTPIREWTIINDPDDNSVIFETPINQSLSLRAMRMMDGLKLNNNEKSLISPINPNSVTISLDSSLQRDRERRQPRMAEPDGYLSVANKNYLFQSDIKNMSRKTPKMFTNPRNNLRWPVISARTWDYVKNKEIVTPTIDPRPFTPNPTKIDVSDSRHGFIQIKNQKISIWSASRLQEWLRCPRAGWLSRSLRINAEESQKEDLDARTHGDLFHKIHHNLLLDILEFDEGMDRDIDFSEKSSIPLNIARSKISPEILMQKALINLDNLAPWLNRSDAVSANRVRMMTGMSVYEWDDWLLDPKPISLSGRIGRMIEAELLLENVIPIALEWNLTQDNSNGILISLPENITLPVGEKLPDIRLRGYIDRVDLVPFDSENDIWINEEGNSEVAPLEIHNSQWTPRRLIIIRDLKTTEKTDINERHYKGVLEELQLALYARAWEESHPGDLVIGVGISVLGHKTSHQIEMSTNSLISNLSKIGNLTEITHDKFRFLNEDDKPLSDPFRAWLASRISVALSVSDRANKGYVNPIPEENNCKYCKVKDICDVKLEGDF